MTCENADAKAYVLVCETQFIVGVEIALIDYYENIFFALDGRHGGNRVG